MAQWIARKASNLKAWGSSPHMDNYESNASVPERSKGQGLRSCAICFVSSNLTACIIDI